MQRLAQEHGAEVVTTAPTVPYQLVLSGGEDMTIDSAADYPSNKKVCGGGCFVGGGGSVVRVMGLVQWSVVEVAMAWAEGFG